MKRLLALLAIGSLMGAAAPNADFAAHQRQSEQVLRFLEERVRQDPDDITALNRLAGMYLQRARESGSVDFILLASRKVKQSLAAVPGELNADGLTNRGRVQFQSHEFAAARDTARQIVRIAPDKVGSFALLGDALLELGDYDEAEAAYAKMRELDDNGANVLARLGRLALLRGNRREAEASLNAAIESASASSQPAPEQVAWCHWQLGEIFFLSGETEQAEGHYRAALDSFPSYYRALGSMGHVRAARGDFAGAIEFLQKAIAVVPDPTFVAALGDLYHLNGREKEARQQYDLVEKIARLTAFHGVLYNRQLALFRADHHVRCEDAYADAAREFAVRKDIYGADAVAWTALRSGKLERAQAAAHEALRLGTQDSRLFYHAGMVELAAGNRDKAAELLGRAMALNAHFDPLQSITCANSLKEAVKKG